jgi:hypothetical protein
MGVGVAAGWQVSVRRQISRSMVASLRRKGFACGVVVTPFDEAL